MEKLGLPALTDYLEVIDADACMHACIDMLEARCPLSDLFPQLSPFSHHQLLISQLQRVLPNHVVAAQEVAAQQEPPTTALGLLEGMKALLKVHGTLKREGRREGLGVHACYYAMPSVSSRLRTHTYPMEQEQGLQGALSLAATRAKRAPKRKELDFGGKEEDDEAATALLQVGGCSCVGWFDGCVDLFMGKGAMAHTIFLSCSLTHDTNRGSARRRQPRSGSKRSSHRYREPPGPSA